MLGVVILADYSNDGVIAKIGRPVLGERKTAHLGNLSLELTSGRVEGYDVSNSLAILIKTPCDDNFSRVEWCECIIKAWNRDISWHFNLLPVHLLRGDGSTRVVQYFDGAVSKICDVDLVPKRACARIFKSMNSRNFFPFVLSERVTIGRTYV